MLPNVMTDASSDSSVGSDDLLLIAVDRPVRSFAYVGAVNDRKGIDTAVEAVCDFPVVLHVFGSIQRLEDMQVDGANYLNEAKARCVATINVYGPVLNTEVWQNVTDQQACLLNPSQLENQPTVVYEAARNRVPMLALRIGPVEEMVENIDAISVRQKSDFRQAVQAILARGSQPTPALRRQVLTGADGWKNLLPALRTRDVIEVTETLRIPEEQETNASHCNSWTLTQLAALKARSVPLVLVLPSAEFTRSANAPPLIVDRASGVAFAPSLFVGAFGGGENDTSLRIQPPFFFAEEKEMTHYLTFPRGAPFVARPEHLEAYILAYRDRPFRAWSFGYYLYSQQQPIISLPEVAASYQPQCKSDVDSHGKLMRFLTSCKISKNVTAVFGQVPSPPHPGATHFTPHHNHGCPHVATDALM